MENVFARRVAFWAAMVGIVFSGYHLLRYIEKGELVNLLPDVRVLQQKPIGELSAGVKYSQTLGYDLKTKGLDIGSLDPCIELLLANYSDRDNEGKFAIGLKAGQVSSFEEVEVGDVNDNRFYKVCFENLNLKDLDRARNVEIILKGVDSPKGKAVTAWTTTDISLGVIVPRRSNQVDRGLVMRLGYMSPVSSERLTSILMLSLIGFFAILTLVFPLLKDSPALTNAEYYE